MKSIRIILVISLGLLQAAAYCQTLSNSGTSSHALSLSLPRFNIASNGVGLKLGGFKLDNQNSLLIYNRNTGTNDIFSLVYQEDLENQDHQEWKYEKRASIILLENGFRANKIDSFNPYGAESLEQGLLAGVLNLLFQ